MGKEKRKGRLNKTGGIPSFGSLASPSSGSGSASSSTSKPAFIGFGAFADVVSSSTATPINKSATTIGTSTISATTATTTVGGGTSFPSSSSSSTISSSCSLSPIYIGHNSTLSILFTKIGQKRDPITKTKALEELKEFFLCCNDEETTGITSKKVKAEGLNHFLYLYKTKLFYDNSPKIRALCLIICRICASSSSSSSSTSSYGIPKAWSKNFSSSASASVSKDTYNENDEILGMIACSVADSASEVRIEAMKFMNEIIFSSPTSMEEEAETGEGQQVASTPTVSMSVYNEGIWMYSKRILSYNNSYDMYQDLFQKGNIGKKKRHVSSTGANDDDTINDSGSGNVFDKKSKNKNKSKNKSNHSKSSSSTTIVGVLLSEGQKEELEERYERIVGTVLDGLRLYLLQLSSLSESGCGSGSTSSIMTPTSMRYLWKAFASNKASLRRLSYMLLSTICTKLKDGSSSKQLSAENTSIKKPASLLPTKDQLIDCDKVSKLLVQSIHSEKEGSNIGLLLETILSYVVSFYHTKEQRYEIMTNYFYKPVSKLFKKGCHNASPASSWTPTVLPFVALLIAPPAAAVGGGGGDDKNKNKIRGGDEIPPSIDLLTNVWEGRQRNNSSNKNKKQQSVTIADDYEVVRAVAETSAFLLAKEDDQLVVEEEDSIVPAEAISSPPSSSAEFDPIIAQCWMNCLQNYLFDDTFSEISTGTGTSYMLSGSAKVAHTELGKILAKSWIQLDRASNAIDDDKNSSSSSSNRNRRSSKIYHMRDWFWYEQLLTTILFQPTATTEKSSSKIRNRYLIQLFEGIYSNRGSNKEQQEQKQPSSSQYLYATPTLGKLFMDLLDKNTKTNSPPTKDVYELWIIILKLIPQSSLMSTIFHSNDEMNEFITNHLSSWTVQHHHTINTGALLSSTATTDANNLALLDVKLLHHLSLSSSPVSLSSSSAPSVFENCWSPILRDVLFSKPNLGILMNCLQYLHNEGAHSVKEITYLHGTNNTSFSKFCTDIARKAVVHYSSKKRDDDEADDDSKHLQKDINTNENNDITIAVVDECNDNDNENSYHYYDDDDNDDDDDDDQQYHTISHFLHACVFGLPSKEFSIDEIEPLVGIDVITEWIDSSCPCSSVIIFNEDEPLEKSEKQSVSRKVMNSNNPVLDTLVILVIIINQNRRRNNDTEYKLCLSDDQQHRVLVQSWMQGGHLWNDTTLTWLSQSVNTAERCLLINHASTESKKMLSDLSSLSHITSNHSTLITIWTDRAYRLLQLCHRCDDDNDDNDNDQRQLHHSSGMLLSLPSLSIVGLGDISLWEGSKCPSLSTCLMKLILRVDMDSVVSNRWELFVNSYSNALSISSVKPSSTTIVVPGMNNIADGYTLKLFVSIAINLSNGGSNGDILSSSSSAKILEVDLARRREDACSKLLNEVGFNYHPIKYQVDDKVKSEAIFCCVSNIRFLLDSAETTTDKKKIKWQKSKICQGIAVLSQLIQSRFLKSLRPSSLSPMLSSNESGNISDSDGATTNAISLDPFDVQVGDNLWYITNHDKPDAMESCVLVKIHRDLPEEVYYTIRLTNRKNDNNQIDQERQTIGKRLRTVPSLSKATTTVKTLTNTLELEKKESEEDSCIPLNNVEENERKERLLVAECIIDKLLNNFDIDDDMSNENDTNKSLLIDSCYYELYNIVITQCGLRFGEKEQQGIGSYHYSIVQKLMNMQQSIMSFASTFSSATRTNGDDTVNVVSPSRLHHSLDLLLWRLAYSLGFGMNIPASKWAVQLIGKGLQNSISDSIPFLVNYDEQINDEDDTNNLPSTPGNNLKIDDAMTAWLSVVCASLTASPVATSYTSENNKADCVQLRNQAFSFLFQLAARLLSDHDNDCDRFHSNQYIALRAIEVGLIESHAFKQGESILEDSEAESITELIVAFSTHWNSDKCAFAPAPKYSWNKLPIFHSIMQNTLRERPNLLAIASRQCLDELTTCLYDPQRRYYAMLILQTYADAARPFIVVDDDDDDDDDNIINKITLERLDAWAKDLLDDEADELEDDVATVSKWVCKEMMNDMESWHSNIGTDNTSKTIDNHPRIAHDIKDNPRIACGRMLSWLSFLSIADSANSVDSVSRLAFTAYASKCMAVESMMNLAIRYCNIGSSDHRKRKIKFDVVIPMGDILENRPNNSIPLSKLAARVIYRSVEAFPTLSKNWWDDSSSTSGCPSYLTQTVKEFVETQVSPVMLNHAVKSIKDDPKAFGEMNVKGSPISREVTATYVQDDFTLSVVIKLPLSYPFRRAEVDCSKTLGVPQSRWKRWSLQITQMLNHQGGSLKDALLLWKENVDKEFEGIEPCPVCYSVLHVKTHKLPNMECNTCQNHFHSDCLFEWFKRSGKTACVICQQPWSGTRI